MNAVAEIESYKVLAVDDAVYGPVDVPTLTQWVQEGRVLRTTWVLSASGEAWTQAGQLVSLIPHFPPEDAEPADPVAAEDASKVSVEELRQFERLSVYSNADLTMLLKYCEVVQAQQGEVIIKKGDLSDAMFLLLSGEVRARLMVGRQETPLGAMHPGEVFGEVAMLSHTPRSADVVAQSDARLVRLTSENFQLLMQEEPELSSRLLFNMARSLATRMAERNLSMAHDIAQSFLWR